jgi:hypothetical protein
MTNSETKPFDKQKLKALKIATTNFHKTTCRFSHALSKGTAQEDQKLTYDYSYNLLSDCVYSYLASLADERIGLSDTNAISILRVYGDFMMLSKFYAEYKKNSDFRDIAKDMTELVDQTMLGEEDDRFELLSDVVRAALQWQELQEAPC